MPYSASAGANASPESFSITRPYPARAALPSVIRVRDEVRLAVHLGQRADGVVEVDVALHEALVRRPAGPLGGRRKALLAQESHGPFEVPPGLLEGSFAVHHAGSGGLAKLFHL